MDDQRDVVELVKEADRLSCLLQRVIHAMRNVSEPTARLVVDSIQIIQMKQILPTRLRFNRVPQLRNLPGARLISGPASMNNQRQIAGTSPARLNPPLHASIEPGEQTAGVSLTNKDGVRSFFRPGDIPLKELKNRIKRSGHVEDIIIGLLFANHDRSWPITYQDIADELNSLGLGEDRNTTYQRILRLRSEGIIKPVDPKTGLHIF